MNGREPAARAALVQAIVARAEALLKADRPEQALGLLDAFKKARPDWGVADQAAALAKIVRQAANMLLDALEEATKKRFTTSGPAPLEREMKILAALKTVSLPKTEAKHAYDPKAPLEERLKQIAAWREALGPTPNEEK